MKCLVTGGAGFIGSHLTDELALREHNVLVVDNLRDGKEEYVNPQADFYPMDLCKKTPVERLIKQQKPQVIYHLAAHAAEGQSVFNPIYTVEQNIIGFLNLLVPAINEGLETFVFTSSMGVYGNYHLSKGYLLESGKALGGFYENNPRHPVDPYGITKATIERLLEIYSKEFGFNYVIFRPHNVYGPRQSLTNPYRNVFGIWMNRIMHGKLPIIYGDGEQTRAFSYIDDCVSIIAESAWNSKAYGEIFNIGSDKVVTINKACELIMDAMGFQGKPIHAPERPLEVKHAWCNQEKIKKVLGFKQSTSLEEGVKKMAEWAKSVGPQPFDYWKDFEITRKVPKVWSEKQL